MVKWVLWDFVLRLIANMMVKVPTPSAAVPYYGGQPTAQEANNNTATAALRRFRQP
jgi:hypothetical protein